MNNSNPVLESFLNLRRRFAAPREQVFRAWTEAAALESWFKRMPHNWLSEAPGRVVAASAAAFIGWLK